MTPSTLPGRMICSTSFLLDDLCRVPGRSLYSRSAFITNPTPQKTCKPSANVETSDTLSLLSTSYSIRLRSLVSWRATARQARHRPEEPVINDIRLALRTLPRMPGFSLAFILTLGLGIGANTAIFSVINGVLLRPLPYPEAERIMHLRQAAVRAGVENTNFSFQEVAD